MGDILPRLGVQSWCFRSCKSIDALLAQVRELGLTRVELCGCHADFSNPAGFAAVVDACRAVGVQITSIGVQGFSGEPKEEAWFKCAQAAGCTMISASFSLARMPHVMAAAAELAEKYNVDLGIHNHGGYDWLGSQNMLGHILRQTSRRVGLCLDTAWMLQAGEDPLKFIAQFPDRLYGVHIKDFTFDPAGRGHDVVVGTGNLKLAELLALVDAQCPHCQCLTLEYEGDVDNPLPKLRECVEKIVAAV